MGVAPRCPGGAWVPTGASCPLLPLSSLLTTCKCAGCWRAAPPTPLQHLPGGVPRGPPGPERFLWGQRGNPCLGAMPMAATRGHQAHSGLQGGPWRPRSGGGSRQPPTAMRALVGVFEVNPAPVLRPAEPWAWAAGAPWGSSRPARAAGAGGPGPDGGDAPGTWGPTQRQAHGGLWSRSKLALSPVQTRATAVTAEPRFPRL